MYNIYYIYIYIYIYNRDYTALQRRNLKIMVTRMKKAKEDGCNDVFITRHGVLMLEGSNLGSVDDFELVIKLASS